MNQRFLLIIAVIVLVVFFVVGMLLCKSADEAVQTAETTTEEVCIAMRMSFSDR